MLFFGGCAVGGCAVGGRGNVCSLLFCVRDAFCRVIQISTDMDLISDGGVNLDISLVLLLFNEKAPPPVVYSCAEWLKYTVHNKFSTSHPLTLNR